MGGASKFFMLLTTPFPLLYLRPSTLRLARHSRVSLACFSSAQNRSFFSNSHSRLVFSINASEQIHTQTSSIKRDDYYGGPPGFSSNSSVLHSWPEWSKLVENLRTGGYFDRQSSSVVAVEGHGDDDFSVFEDLPKEFVRAANACLSFARDRSDLLRLLSKKDIEVVVENVSPFLFKSAVDSARRMKSFFGSNGSNELEFEMAHTVDLLRFLLSYACNPVAALDGNNLNNRELVESSVRNLLSELLNASRTVGELDLSGSMPKHFPDGEIQRPLAQNTEMKRGDWICPKCSFMNFARNVKCLECDVARPKRQPTGGEWECPQCDFFNYGRNAVCFRCNCKCPGEASFGTAGLRPGLGYNNVSVPNKADIESRLAANEEKAERWFSKVSQLDSASDLSSAMADEDFPEIMPLRKGVNRFVVSTRKTPLERRLANAQYRRNLGNDGTTEGKDFQAEDGVGPAKTSDTSISQSLDGILGRSSAVSETDNSVTSAGDSTGRESTGIERSPISSSASPQYRWTEGSNSSYVPFVSLPADMFAKSQKSKMEEGQATGNYNSVAAQPDDLTDYSVSLNADSSKSRDCLPLPGMSVNQAKSKEDKEQAEISRRWFKKVEELHDDRDLASAISDEEFPEIMPMRKGENCFVVSKKKDRSLTSPLYKRRMSMEQADGTNVVPFVPFPPDYFAKKDKQPETRSSTEKVKDGSSAASVAPEIQDVPEKSEQRTVRVPDREAAGNSMQWLENQQFSRESLTTGFPRKGLNESKVVSLNEGPTGFSTRSQGDLWATNRESWNGGHWQESRSDSPSLTGRSTQQPENPQTSRESWNRGFSGRSLEGSAVKELDPLDMSEEAKAERWFRRVAQIKDISELSKIPDEDFPSIMPMRKGVNRFVVSKRKTPLERRLTSPQYRRNLPIVSSEPVKKENNES